MSIDCGKARRLLWPDAGPQPASPEVVAAQHHMAACSACQRFVRDMRAIGDLIHDAAPREQAPAEVRGRLFTALARARASTLPTPRRRVSRWLIAASVIVVALAGTVAVERFMRDAPADPISAIVEDHARAVSEAQLASPDRSEVARWISGQVNFAMHVPVLPGARLLGARVCVVDGRRGAVVEYDVNGLAVSYFVVPDETESADDARPVRFDRTTRAGYDVVSWREPGLLHAMIGNLPGSQLARLARICVEQARGVVARLGEWIQSQEG